MRGCIVLHFTFGEAVAAILVISRSKDFNGKRFVGSCVNAVTIGAPDSGYGVESPAPPVGHFD